MGIGDWGLGPIPNPQAETMDQCIIYISKIFKFIFYFKKMEDNKNDGQKKNNNTEELKKLLTNKDQIPSPFIDKITDKIYLGDIDGASDFDYLSKEKISNVLSVINIFEYLYLF